MTGEEMERAIEFLTNYQARISADIEALKDSQKQTEERVNALTDSVTRNETQMGEMRATVVSVIEEMREGFSNLTEEMREGFNNLIVANEVTRKLAEETARLAISTSHRVTRLEEKPQ